MGNLMEISLLAIDPGGMCGIAWWGEDYQLISYAQVSLLDLPNWLDTFEPKPKLILFENFKLWRHRALQQSGSDLPASQTIGMIKSYAILNKIPIVDQSPQVLKQAELMFQTKMPSDHSQSHWVSAYLHGQYWLVKQGFRQVELALEDQ